MDDLPKNIHFDTIRSSFPQLKRKVKEKELVYLDNAATTLKPQIVIDSMIDYYTNHCANVHRGAHTLSEEATELYEKTRDKMQIFLKARNRKEIVFTSGVTDAVNLVAHHFESELGESDEIIISQMEHHSNFVPWKILAEKTQATLQIVRIDEKGELDLDDLQKKLSKKTKILSIVHTSNVLGTTNPIKKIISWAHDVGAKVFIDAAQSVSHQSINVVDLDCDYLALSGHKIFGPTGVGVLYGKWECLEKMRPYRSGGEMVLSVSEDHVLYKNPPYRFEAGTPPIAQAIGLGAAVDFVEKVGLSYIADQEKKLLHYANEKLLTIKSLKIIGNAAKKVPIFSFTLDGVHPHDISTILNDEGIAIRSGQHCAQPLLHFFRLQATARASFSFYNTLKDVDKLVSAIKKCVDFFAD